MCILKRQLIKKNIQYFVLRYGKVPNFPCLSKQCGNYDDQGIFSNYVDSNMKQSCSV